MFELVKDLALYMRQRKKYFLAPLIVVIILVGLLVFLGSTTGTGPFIYTVF